MKRSAVIAVMMGIVLGLAGCGDEGPSDADVTSRLKQYALQARDKAQQAMQAVKASQDTVMEETDPKVAARVKDLQDAADKVLDATSITVKAKGKQADGSYDATVVTAGPQGQQNSTVKLIKTGPAWQVVDVHS